MPSLRSRLLNFTTRILMRAVFRGERPLLELRAAVQRRDVARERPLLPGLSLEEVEMPVRGRWLHNAGRRSEQVLLYLHGGAFSFRMVHGHTEMVASFCAGAGVQAFMPWYRLAPEDPFPAGPEDCLSAYRYLLDAKHEARDIVVMGDSAGGNLALSLLHSIQAHGLPMPGGVIALSPVTDMAQISATWRMNSYRDPMYCAQGAVNPARWYFRGHNPLNPLISPCYGSFAGFPPLYFIVGSVEALLDDSVGMVRKAVDAGVPAKVQIWAGMPHVFPLMTMLPEAAPARATIVGWIEELHAVRPPVAAADLYRACVELVDLQPLTHRLLRQTNDVFIADWCGPPAR